MSTTKMKRERIASITKMENALLLPGEKIWLGIPFHLYSSFRWGGAF